MSPRDERYLGLARHIAAWSKDPSTKVGAVITRPDRTVVSVGYNGFPRGVNDDAHALNNREKRLALTVHAEVNAILNAHQPVTGCTLYCTWPPCSHCAGYIIQSGITRVVFGDLTMPKRWRASVVEALNALSAAGVHYSGSIIWED